MQFEAKKNKIRSLVVSMPKTGKFQDGGDFYKMTDFPQVGLFDFQDRTRTSSSTLVPIFNFLF